MNNDHLKLSDVREEMLFLHRKKVLDSFKEGFSLGEICRETCLDISSVLFVLRKSKLKKQSLYKIYQEQSLKNDERQSDLFLESDKFYIDKFFPEANSSNFSNSYYWYWQEKNKKEQDKKLDCTHNVRTIRCSLCNKILRDASNIPLENITITKIDV